MLFRSDPLGKKPCENFACSIHSVKRLSDGEVFTVGDFVSTIDKQTVNDIQKFQISGNKMLLIFDGWDSQWLQDIQLQKVVPAKPIPVLLTPAQIEKLKTLLNG